MLEGLGFLDWGRGSAGAGLFSAVGGLVGFGEVGVGGLFYRKRTRFLFQILIQQPVNILIELQNMEFRDLRVVPRPFSKGLFAL